MKFVPLKPKEYLFLKEKGIDINACNINFKIISVRCEDLNLYKKAFRVKIRALIKEGNLVDLKRYVNAFYTLAYFVRFLYGFHSCSNSVEAWQEELAFYLQTKFEESRVKGYDKSSWIIYKSDKTYEEHFKMKYKELSFNTKSTMRQFIQDNKPFLNLKDKAHFTKCL